MEHRNFETINLDITGTVLDYTVGRKLAEILAESILSEPMIIAWYDGKRNEEHPHVPECQHKPGWIAYAEGHGGKLQININEDEYSFIFSDAIENIGPP
jgi:hypothetical protein